MNTSRLRRLAMACRPLFFSVILINALSRPAAAADASLSGKVMDQLGAPIANAAVTLVRDGERVNDTTTDASGEFTFGAVTAGRYHVEAAASGFEPRTSDALFVSIGRARIDIALQVGTVAQHVIVTASADSVPQAQVGAAVTVLDGSLLEALGNTDLLEPLRMIPGAAVVQNGGRGGTPSAAHSTSPTLRRRASNAWNCCADRTACFMAPTR